MTIDSKLFFFKNLVCRWSCDWCTVCCHPRSDGSFQNWCRFPRKFDHSSRYWWSRSVRGEHKTASDLKLYLQLINQNLLFSHQLPKRLGKFEQMDSGNSLTTADIVQRIIENRLQYTRRNEKKIAQQVRFRNCLHNYQLEAKQQFAHQPKDEKTRLNFFFLFSK